MQNHTPLQRDRRARQAESDARNWAFDVYVYALNARLLERATDAEVRTQCAARMQAIQDRWPGKTLA